MKVFISHAQVDEPLARRVADVLQEAGLDVWDERQILPGDNWAAKIGEALQEAEAMVVLLTPEALRSNHVRHDISYALGKQEYSGRLIPVLAGPQDSLPKEEIPWILWNLKPITLSEQRQEEGIRQIAHVLMSAA